MTDLERVQPAFHQVDDQTVRVWAEIETELGAIEKLVTINGAAEAIELEYLLRWPELPAGSLRAANVTLHPESFDRATLWYATHNGGGELERHRLDGSPFDHGQAVSALVSTGDGLGLTEGVVLLGDAYRQLQVNVDQSVARPLGLIAFRPERERYFLRLSFSITESDDTRRGGIPRDPSAPQRLRVVIRAAPAS